MKKIAELTDRELQEGIYHQSQLMVEKTSAIKGWVAFYVVLTTVCFLIGLGAFFLEIAGNP